MPQVQILSPRPLNFLRILLLLSYISPVGHNFEAVSVSSTDIDGLNSVAFPARTREDRRGATLSQGVFRAHRQQRRPGHWRQARKPIPYASGGLPPIAMRTPRYWKQRTGQRYSHTAEPYRGVRRTLQARPAQTARRPCYLRTSVRWPHPALREVVFQALIAGRTKMTFIFHY